MKWSVLDQSPASEGSPEERAIQESLVLARQCDALGYERFWVSEHHSAASIVGTAPEILVAAIAATTRRIRVGSAGVMLPHYSALKVAEQFRVLEAIAPGRMDLGVGRAPGSDALTARALNPYSNVAELAYFFSEGEGVDEALALYRRNYRPSARHPTPQATVCVWALAVDTESEARRLLTAREHWRAGFKKGLRLPLVSPEHAFDPEARRHSYAILAAALGVRGAASAS